MGPDVRGPGFAQVEIEQPGFPRPGIDISPANRAGFWVRVIGRFLDFLVLVAVSGLIGTVLGIFAGFGLGVPLTIPGSFVILNFLYWTFYEGYTGKSLGKRPFGLIVLPLDNTHITIGQAFLRFIGMVVSDMLLGLPYLFLLGRNRMALHDYISRTVVVYEYRR